MIHTVHLLQDDEATIGAWLRRCEGLHRSLRPALAADYESYMRLMFAEGARMAVLHAAEVPKAIAVYRIQHTTFHGRRCYLDDLVTVENERGKGYGAAMLGWVEEVARADDCDTLSLDSGVQRAGAHRFYFRHELAISSFGFTKSLRRDR